MQSHAHRLIAARILAIVAVLVLVIGLVPAPAASAASFGQPDGVPSLSPQADDHSIAKVGSGLFRRVQAKQQLLARGHLRAPAAQTGAEGGFAFSEGTDLASEQVFLHFASEPTQAQLDELSALGVKTYPESWIPPVGDHPTGFMLADLPVDKLEAVASLASVERINTAEETSELHNDLGRTAMNVSPVWTGGNTGAGVKVAVIDSSLDLTHPDIPTPVGKKDYSNYPTLDDDISGTGSGHGTHVTGSVLGRGTLNTAYKGSAPGASLIFLKVMKDSDGTIPSAGLVAAIRAASDVYNADIITMSIGSFYSIYHDGTDEKAQAVDYVAGRGATMFVSSGNSGVDAQHSSVTVPANSTSGFIQLNLTSSNTDGWVGMVWYDGPGATNQMSLRYYNSSQTELTAANSLDSFTNPQSSRGTESKDYWFNTARSAGTYYLKVQNASSSPQLVHLYFYYRGSGSFASPDPFYTYGSPSDADGAIAVGAYTTRKYWTNYQGSQYSRSDGQTEGQISTFSSRGPRVDAAVKPNVVGPGSAIISTRHSTAVDTQSTSYMISNGASGLPANYYVMSGTSMATPLVAGVGALVKQAHPTWTPAQIKAALQNTAVDKGAVGPDGTYGYGLVNAQAATGSGAPPAASITVTSPNGGESWAAGTTHDITWTSSNVTGNVKIELSRDNGGTWSNIIATTGNTGTYPWLIPAGTPATTQALVRISSVTTPTVVDQSNAVFTITAGSGGPSITVTAPNGGEDWATKTYQNITWTSASVTGYVKIEVSRDGGGTWSTLMASYPNTGSYRWYVTGPSTAQALVRVSSVMNPAISDESYAVFTISGPTITVTSPNGGENWAAGSYPTITWSSTALSSMSYVSISLSRDGGTTWTVIVPSTLNDGTHNTWRATGPGTANALIKVASMLDRTIYDVSDAPFTITVPPPTIMVTAPNGGQVWATKTFQSITWTSASVTGTVKIEVSRNNGGTWTTLVASYPNTGTFRWYVTGPATTQALVRVSSVMSPAASDISDAVFSISGPTITVTSPNGGENWTAGSYPNITWSSTLLLSSSYVSISLSRDGGATWMVIVPSTLNDGTHNTWRATGPGTANALIKVASMLDRTIYDVSDAPFTITVPPPTITVTSPNGGETWTASTLTASYYQNITWTSASITGYVKIEISRNSGATWTTLVAFYPNTGTYRWRVIGPASSQALVRVTSVVNPAVTDTSDATFTIS